MATIQLKNISKIYNNGAKAVSNVNVDIQDGEFIVIVGPSGCGKSTLLRMVAGLETITSGELLIDEQIVNNLEPKERGIAMVFQNYALYPHMTNRANMAYSLKIAGVAKEEVKRRVETVAEHLQLTEHLDRKPSQLSGGQRQRVAMGRAIVREPKVFLFDEPLSNLDAKLRVEMRKQIKGLQRELNITSLYVTHDQVEAMTMADRLIVLKDGFVQQIGAPMDLYNSPQNSFVAEFIGSPAMNLMPADIEGDVIKLAPNITIPKPATMQQQGRVTLGIRPEHTNVSITPQDSNLRFTIDIIEHLGNVSLLHGHLLGLDTDFVVQTSINHPWQERQQIGLTFSAQDLHIFDAVDGKRLS